MSGLKILVCVKRVPDDELLQPDRLTGLIDRSKAGGVINPYDAYGLEMALRLRDHAPCSITLLSMGPSAAEETLRAGLALGADSAVLLCDGRFGGADTLATSYTLAAAVRRLEREGGAFDLVICGRKATDGDTAQVGAELAERLGLPQITNVLSLDSDGRRFTASRDGGAGFETAVCAAPCLVTAGKPFYAIRQASLKGRLAAKKADVIVWGADDLDIDLGKIGLRGSQTRVLRVFEPMRGKKAVIIDGGSVGDLAETLLKILADCGGGE